MDGDKSQLSRNREPVLNKLVHRLAGIFIGRAEVAVKHALHIGKKLRCQRLIQAEFLIQCRLHLRSHLSVVGKRAAGNRVHQAERQ